jgi:hypothetical protein
MKKVLAFTVALLIGFSSLVYAGGDKNRGSKGQGPTGGTGSGSVTQGAWCHILHSELNA